MDDDLEINSAIPQQELEHVMLSHTTCSTQSMVCGEETDDCRSFESSNDEADIPQVLVISRSDENSANTSALHGTSLEDVLHQENVAISELNMAPMQQTKTSNKNLEESDISQAWFTSREDKSSLQNKGHVWKQGMWSKEETDLLQTNIATYCTEQNIGQPSEIIFEMTKDERKDFYRTIAKGLNRPLFSVYRRVIRIYDNKNHVGKYTAEEIDRLKQLRAKHGNDWQAIGLALGRSASSIKDRCRLMKDNCNTGKWLPEEERRLAEAVYELSQCMPGENITSGICWAAVAEKVVTRSEKQCRTKWLNYLNWKQLGGTDWTREDDINLITRVYRLKANDENEVDWFELARDWPSVRSPQWLRGKWWNLKKHVPESYMLQFRDICEFLFRHVTENILVKEDPIVAATPVTITTSIPTIPMTMAGVSLLQSSNIVSAIHPLRLDTDHNSIIRSAGLNGSGASPHEATGMTFQAFEIIPGDIHLPQTSSQPAFLIAPAQTTIPCTAYPTTAGGHIIIQALPMDTLSSNENVTVQMNLPTQIIINTTAAGLTAPIQLTRPLVQTTASLPADHIVSHGGVLLTTANNAVHLLHTQDIATGAKLSEISAQTEVPIVSQDDSDEEDDEDDEDDDPTNMEEADTMGSLSDSAQETCTDLDPAESHLIADPMLSSNNISDLGGHAADVDSEKLPPIHEEILDSQVGTT